MLLTDVPFLSVADVLLPSKTPALARPAAALGRRLAISEVNAFFTWGLSWSWCERG
jgi:hypothetical protein